MASQATRVTVDVTGRGWSLITRRGKVVIGLAVVAHFQRTLRTLLANVTILPACVAFGRRFLRLAFLRDVATRSAIEAYLLAQWRFQAVSGCVAANVTGEAALVCGRVGAHVCRIGLCMRGIVVIRIVGLRIADHGVGVVGLVAGWLGVGLWVRGRNGPAARTELRRVALLIARKAHLRLVSLGEAAVFQVMARLTAVEARCMVLHWNNFR